MNSKQFKNYTKFTILIDYSLFDLKRAYRNFHGEKGKVTKHDISIWLGSLAEADVTDYVNQETESE